MVDLGVYAGGRMMGGHVMRHCSWNVMDLGGCRVRLTKQLVTYQGRD